MILMPGTLEIMLIGLLCFNLGNALGYKRHSNEHHRKPDKQIVINDSTKVVNIYVDGHGIIGQTHDLLWIIGGVYILVQE